MSVYGWQVQMVLTFNLIIDMICSELIKELKKYDPNKNVVFIKHFGKSKMHIPIEKVRFNEIFNEIDLHSYEN